MNKKIILIVLVIFCVIGLFILSRFWNLWHSAKLLNSKSLSIEQLIIESIRIQYRGGSKKELNKIFTSDFIKQIDSNPHFYKKKIFYTFNKDFMQSFRELDRNQSMVSIRAEDSSGSYVQIITLTKDSNGKYLISKIEFDI